MGKEPAVPLSNQLVGVSTSMVEAYVGNDNEISLCVGRVLAGQFDAARRKVMTDEGRASERRIFRRKRSP